MIEPGELTNRMQQPARSGVSSLSNREEMMARDLGLPSSQRYVTPAQLAMHWGLSPRTIQRDIGKHALRAFRTPTGKYLIRLSDALRYLRPSE